MVSIFLTTAINKRSPRLFLLWVKQFHKTVKTCPLHGPGGVSKSRDSGSRQAFPTSAARPDKKTPLSRGHGQKCTLHFARRCRRKSIPGTPCWGTCHRVWAWLREPTSSQAEQSSLVPQPDSLLILSSPHSMLPAQRGLSVLKRVKHLSIEHTLLLFLKHPWAALALCPGIGLSTGNAVLPPADRAPRQVPGPVQDQTQRPP